MHAEHTMQMKLCLFKPSIHVLPQTQYNAHICMYVWLYSHMMQMKHTLWSQQSEWLWSPIVCCVRHTLYVEGYNVRTIHTFYVEGYNIYTIHTLYVEGYNIYTIHTIYVEGYNIRTESWTQYFTPPNLPLFSLGRSSLIWLVNAKMPWEKTNKKCAASQRQRSECGFQNEYHASCYLIRN